MGHVSPIYLTNKVILQELDNFNLPISVSRILNDPLDSHQLSVPLESTSIDLPECSLPYLLE